MSVFKSTIDHNLSLWNFRLRWFEHYLATHYVRIAQRAFVALGVLVALQLAYPSGLTPPRTYIGGDAQGMKFRVSVARSIDKLNEQPLRMALANQEVSAKFEETGVKIDGNASVDSVTNYPWYERLIPFSIFRTRTNSRFVVESKDPKYVKEFAQSLGKYNKEPVDASAVVAGADVKVTPAQEGVSYEATKVEESLINASIAKDLLVRVPATVSMPAIGTEEAEITAGKLRTRLDIPFEITAGEHKIQVDRNTLGSWAEFVPSKDKSELQLAYSRDKVKQTLMKLSSVTNITQVSNTITLVDGESAGGSNGSKGQVLLLDDSIDAVIAAALANEKTSTAKLQTVTPQTKVIKTYTRSSKGVQTLVNDWGSSHSGQFGIALRSTDGSIVASYNGNKTFTSASIYKVYLAYVVYTKADAGELSLEATTSTGLSINGCIDAMIVYSNNECAVTLGSMVGWNSNDAKLHAQGFGSTTLTTGAFLTTANDTASLLSKLQANSLMPTGHTNELISMMKRQIYRSGIPAGSQGAVANKVGFLDGLNHDAAIVYHAKGHYILVVLTSGSSFSEIADLSRKISSVMGQ